MRCTLLPIALLLCHTLACAQSSAQQAATTPLRDLNLSKAEIPPLLQAARQAPYALPEARACEALAKAVAELDAVLGPDVDAPSPAQGSTAGQVADDAVRSAAESVIPFRGWVRKLSGAEREAKDAAAAIAAGTARRSFLKGMQAGSNCKAS